MVHRSSALALAAAAFTTCAAAVEITVQSSGGNATNGHQYGFLHEDINNSGDGGLYAELIRNRAFQSSEGFPASLDAWYPVNGAQLSLNAAEDDESPLSEALPASINVAAAGGDGLLGFFNDGYWGMDVKSSKTYSGSFWVRGAYEGSFTAELRSNITEGETFGSATVESESVAGEWTEHTFELTPDTDAPNSNNTFALLFDAAGAADGSLDFNLISLFPPTYKDRKNGMRIDLVEALEGFHPTLFRIPGGNMLEGNTNSSWWDWKDSIGPLRNRPGFAGVWGYPQTHGLGLMEYLELAEDMGNLEVVLGVWAGLALNGDITPQEELSFYIDDALAQIEFVRGDAETTEWGARRAELGHPDPFPLRYVEVGNEDWLAGAPEGWDTYKEYRFPMFLEAINEAYPDIQVISSGSVFDGYEDIPAPGAGDYHLYAEPDTLQAEFGKFDHVEVEHIIGEIAATHPNGGVGFDGDQRPFPWWQGAVTEAIGLVSYERNQDRIIGTAYAPILRSMDRWQWPVCMIQHTADPALTTRSTSWYIWELFAGHIMSETLPSTSVFDPIFHVSGRSEDGYIFKAAVYNSTTEANPEGTVPVKLTFEGVEAGAEAELTVLTGPEGDPWAYNDPFTGVNVVKTEVTRVVAAEGGAFEFELPDLSVALLDTGR